MYIVIYEEGDCGCEYDPYRYQIIGIFNKKEIADICLQRKQKQIDEIKNKKYMYYRVFIEEVDSPLRVKKGDIVYVVIKSYKKGGNFESIEGVFRTEEYAKKIVDKKHNQYREDRDIAWWNELKRELYYIFRFTVT
jgi:hypothetical protein